MKFVLNDLIKDINNIDIEDILSAWQWLISDMYGVVMVSCLGDIFMVGNDNAIYWLQTDCGSLTKIAASVEEFEYLLSQEENIDNWFLPMLVEKLITAEKTLKDNEVYSYTTPPVIGGEYSIENIKPTDMSVHFSFSGQICEQIKDLPDGTKVNVRVKK